MPQYLVSGYLPDNFDPSTVSEATVEEIHALNREMIAAGVRKFAGGLGPARTLRAQPNGELLLTDGPYLETKEYLASWYLIDVDSEERALEIAAALPSAIHQPTEVWPILHEASRETGADMGVA